MPSTPRSLPKHIAATLAKPVMGAVVALLFFTVLSPATLVARVVEPDAPSQIRLPTPTPARAQSSAGASIQPTPNPTLADPIGTVLVERLRLRAGPGEGFPILERTFPGDQLALLGQTSGCEWLFVTSPSGQSGWVSGDSSLVRINVGCALLHVVETIVPTPTLSPTSTDTIAPTPTRTRTPTPTATPLTAPVVTLRPAISPWTPTPTPRPTLRPTATSNAPATTAATAPALAIQPTRDPLIGFALVGPRSVEALLPESGTETFQRIPFSWVADQPLAPGQLFEVAFWRKGQPMEEAHGWTAATTNNTLSANTYEQTPGEYLWGVWLGAMVDGQYHRLRYLGGGNLLHVLSEAPQESAPSAPAPTDCPPTAPCK